MGSWEGRTFTNSWLALSLTLPEGSYIYTDEDMSLILGAGQEILVNNGTYTDEQLEQGNIITIYDFMAALPDGQSSIQLVYENTRYSARGKDMTAAQYLDDKLSTSIDEKMCQEFYCRRIGNRMATLTISFLPESQSMIDEIVEGIAAP